MAHIRIFTSFLRYKHHNQLLLIKLCVPRRNKATIFRTKLRRFKQYQILLLLGFAILTPIFEELIFRGFILHFFSERFPFWIAAVLTSFFFGIAHTYSLGVMVITFFMGLLMAILCKKTKSILPAMLFHIINNTLAFFS